MVVSLRGDLSVALKLEQVLVGNFIKFSTGVGVALSVCFWQVAGLFFFLIILKKEFGIFCDM